MISEALLSVGSMLVELGVPAGLAVAYARMPGFRKRAAVMLGATFPFLVLYASCAVAYLWNPTAGNAFAYGAMWIMSFAVFLACVFLAALVSLARRPLHPFSRFAMGFSVPFCLAGLIVIGTSI